MCSLFSLYQFSLVLWGLFTLCSLACRWRCDSKYTFSIKLCVPWSLPLPCQLPISLLTLTVHSPTKSNKGKWRKCAKSDYVMEAGLIWERNRCPGSDPRVAWHGCTVHLVREAPGSKPRRGTPIFGPLPFRGDSLEMKKGAWELGLKTVQTGSVSSMWKTFYQKCPFTLDVVCYMNGIKPPKLCNAAPAS